MSYSSILMLLGLAVGGIIPVFLKKSNELEIKD